MATITATTTDIYERPSYKETETEQTHKSGAKVTNQGGDGIRLPRMLWVAGAIFACNLVVMSAVALTPEMNVGLYGEETSGRALDPKPSPFDQVVETIRPRPVKLAERIRPVVVQEATAPPTSGYVEASYTDLSLPRASQTAIPVRRASETSRAAESTLVLPRSSQTSLQVPRASQAAIPVRRASESAIIRTYSPGTARVGIPDQPLQ